MRDDGVNGDGDAVIAQCTNLLFTIANLPNSIIHSRLDEMRFLFATMERFSETGTVSEDCLWRAARAGNTEVLAYLLRERQVDPNARRALTYAMRHGMNEAEEMLIAHGAVVHETDTVVE